MNLYKITVHAQKKKKKKKKHGIENATLISGSV